MHTHTLLPDLCLYDEIVSLVPLQESHFEQLLPFALNEPDTWQYSLISAAGPDQMQQYIYHALKEMQNGTSFVFVVMLNSTKQIIGSTRFYDINPIHQTLAIGYTWYGQAFRGTGVNIHCKRLLLAYAFDTMLAQRVEFRADSNNKISIAAMRSIGCTYEGILRSNCQVPNSSKRRDSVVLSILLPEWQNTIKNLLDQKIANKAYYQRPNV